MACGCDPRGKALSLLPALVWCASAAAAPPPEFSGFFGKRMQMCQGCHGAPPSLPHSDSASRIVAVGATARNGAELRKKMSAKHLGIAMEWVLEDPALTNEKLEVIRLYLLKVRDGDAPAAVDFGEAKVGAASVPAPVTVRNERTVRDPAAVIASIRATGDFTVVPGGSCEAGGSLKGQSACIVNVQFSPRSKGARAGKLEFLFAPTPGLVPQKRVTQLSGTGVAR